MTKAVARSRASKRRRRNVDPPDLEALRPYTGLYMIYHTHARKTLWKLARGGRIGAIKCPTIEAVPPPCAELFLRHLEWGYQLERDVDDEEGRASTITSFLADARSERHASRGWGEQMDKQEAETAHSCPPWARDKIPGLPASVVAVWVCTRRVPPTLLLHVYNAVSAN